MSKPLNVMIDEVIGKRLEKVPEDAAERADHLRRLTGLEDTLVVALSHTGPVVWYGRLWASSIPARTGPLIEVHCQPADRLSWPPPEPEPLTEKTAGFISERELDK
jgi:hypothetical protein